MILSATSDDRLDAPCTQGAPSRLAVVSAIHDKDIRMTARSAALARNAGHIGDCRQCLCAVAGIRRRGVHDRRHAASIHDESLLRTQFPGLNRAWASGVVAAESADHDAIGDRQLGCTDASHPEQYEKVHVEIVSHCGCVPSSKLSDGRCGPNTEV